MVYKLLSAFEKAVKEQDPEVFQSFQRFLERKGREILEEMEKAGWNPCNVLSILADTVWVPPNRVLRLRLENLEQIIKDIRRVVRSIRSLAPFYERAGMVEMIEDFMKELQGDAEHLRNMKGVLVARKLIAGRFRWTMLPAKTGAPRRNEPIYEALALLFDLRPEGSPNWSLLAKLFEAAIGEKFTLTYATLESYWCKYKGRFKIDLKMGGLILE